MVFSLRQLFSASLLLVCVSAGCEGRLSDFIPPETSLGKPASELESAALQPGSPVSFGAGRPSIRDEITVASWNIQVFGASKISHPEVMQVIVDVVRRFDVIAIQELRSKDQGVISEFLSMVNTDGYRYGVVVGPRLGRTTSKEQYLYLYDSSRIELLDGSVYTVNDPQDRLHREPLVASFRVTGALSGNPWTFTRSTSTPTRTKRSWRSTPWTT